MIRKIFLVCGIASSLLYVAINIGVFLLWVVVLAIVLLRAQRTAPQGEK